MSYGVNTLRVTEPCHCVSEKKNNHVLDVQEPIMRRSVQFSIIAIEQCWSNCMASGESPLRPGSVIIIYSGALLKH